MNKLRIQTKKIRKGLGLTQAFLAEKVGIRVATLSDFENGKTSMGSDTLDLIFKEFETQSKSKK